MTCSEHVPGSAPALRRCHDELVGARDSSKAPASMFFEFRLSRSGMPGRLHRLSVRLPDQPADLVGDMALTADGTELAVAGQAGRVAVIQVVSLASGAVRTWSGVGSADWLSWIGDHALDFSWAGPAARAPEIVMLRTTSRGGSLPGSFRVLVPATARFGKFVGMTYGPATATSRAVFALMAYPLAPPDGPGMELGVVEFSARTGQPLRVIIKSAQSGMGSFCGVLWADRSGLQLVSSCGWSAGSTKDGRFTPWVPLGRQPFRYSLRSIPIAW
jgi:hypothetical protein